MNNKSQISLFVIIGVIVVVSVIILTQMNPNYTPLPEQNLGSNELYSFQNFILACLERTAQRGIVENLERGGYYETTSYDYITDNFLVNVPVYVDKDLFLIPSKSIFEDELSKFIVNEIDICLDNFSSFENIGYSITTNDEFSTNIMILQNSILIESQLPISVTTPSKNSFDIEDFRIEIDTNIKGIINHLEEFLEIHYDDFSQFPISSLILLSDFEDFLFELDQIDDTIILTFIYNHNSTSSISNSITSPINYNFAMNYDFVNDELDSFDLLSDQELFPDEWDWED